MTTFKAPPVACRRPGPPTDSAGLGATIRPNFDLNDLAAMAVGDDPLAAQKRWFLRQTEPLRDSLAAKARKQDLSRAAVAARRRAAAVLSDRDLAFPAKRRLLFELWDECEEPAHEGDLRPEVAAGLRARELIEGLVRQKLPRGGEGAYSASELRRLNSKRSSKRRFSPYR